MGIRVYARLYNRLQFLLPPEADGSTELELPDGSTVQDLYRSLGITRRYPTVVNGVMQKDTDRILQDGDQVAVFAPVSGG